VLRNKRRTGLTVLSIGFSLFLLMTLLTVQNQLLNPTFDTNSALRLITIPTTSLADMLPLSYLDKIKRIPHVEHVAPLQWFNGIYKDPDFLFANFGTDAKNIFDIYTEQTISPEDRAAFESIRTGAAASETLAKRFGWKRGDKITLQGTIFPVDLELTLTSIFKDPLSQEMLYFHQEYLDEALGNWGMVGAYVIKATDAEYIPEIGESVDATFRNSSSETRTQTEKAFVLGFVAMLGNIQTIIGSVVSVVVFTMLLVAVSTMAMTVRERLREVAILKTMGYPRRTLLTLVMAEALFISLMGACLGIALGQSLNLMDLNRVTQGFIVKINPSLATYAAVLGVGAAIGLISGFFPAWQAVNLTITTAMRRLD
jgi:putative ABC transport system permease protein